MAKSELMIETPARGLSAEFHLAAACCRSPGETRDAVVRARAGGIDWKRFGRVLARHRIEGLAHEALRRAEVEPGPAESAAMREAAGEIGLAALRMAAETGRLQSALDGAGIDNLVLKGAAIEMLAWGRIGLKRAWDIDLLVMEDDAAAARRILERSGYGLEHPAEGGAEAFAAWVALSKECVFRHERTGLVVELHWRLADAATLLPGLSARSRHQVVRLSETIGLRTLAREDLFAYLCVHGASHAWARLKWLADLGALLNASDEAGRTNLYRQALDRGAGHCPASAFILCEQLLGLPVPTEVAAEIAANRKARRLADFALAVMAGGGEAETADRPLLDDRIRMSQFLFRDGWAYRFAEFRRQWISLDDHMRLRLPPGLGFLYGPIRAPLWVWRRLCRMIRRP
jgi:hypothetical protein